MLHLTAQIVLPPDFILVYLWYRLCIWLQHAVAPPPVSFRNTGFSWTYGILHSCITLALLRFAVINWKKIWFFGVKSWFFTRNTQKIFAPPSAIGNNMIFWRKIVIFHTKYPKTFRASLRSAQFFLSAPP